MGLPCTIGCSETNFFWLPPHPRRGAKEQGEQEETRFLVETGFLSPSPTTFNNASFWEKLLGNCVLNKFIKISKKRYSKQAKELFIVL